MELDADGECVTESHDTLTACETDIVSSSVTIGDAVRPETDKEPVVEVEYCCVVVILGLLRDELSEVDALCDTVFDAAAVVDGDAVMESLMDIGADAVSVAEDSSCV